MKPRTKLQLRVKDLSDKLPVLTDEQKQWGFKNCLQHAAYRTKFKSACLDCGHVWETEDSSRLIVILGERTCICPGCGVQLTINDTRKKKVYQREFLGLLDAVEGFQVNRFFEIHSFHKVGTPMRLVINEVVQQWLQPNGKNEVVAMNRGNMNGYSDNFHGNLEIRANWNLNHKYNILPTLILPHAKCLPIYRRNGLKGKIDINITPFDLFTALIKDNIAETLLKSKQTDLLRARIGDRKSDVGRYWDSVKICIRNKYIVKEAITWLDYLQLLSYFKKDLRNTKYICPKNLKLEHNTLIAKKTELDKREKYTRWLVDLGKDINVIKRWSGAQLKDEYDRIIAEKNAIEKAKVEAKRKKELEQDELLFLKDKAAFFGIVFSSDHLTIKVLESIQEFIEEGEAHKHCVFTNKYYKKEDSLILSARLDGKPLETIEIDLKKMKITQSRGLENKASDYNQQILELVRKNMRVIKKKYKQLKSVAA